ncbi:TonB-dependent receptor [Marinicella rhabdoformis]|uniref:TonB-dependent receptor n=1 Tax=Marinicella rhabdoformis TaxID=2580566 RepID=UPI0012AEDAC2|nr:TonB-dependent receptor [Marinicella rhabdoformis]
MRYIFLLVLAFGAKAQTDTADLIGSLIDKSGEPLAQVTVHLLDLNTQTQTNNQGVFTFEQLPLGEYEIDIEISTQQHYNTSIQHDGTEVTINVDDVALDKLVVSANPLEHNQLKMTTPVSILDEEQLVMDRSLSIDQTLNSITGVNSGSFGAGSGQVVIRGQQGPRVKVLQNNTGLQDASSVSPDHWISSESLLAKQIEVLKGPATLLYGGGAVGGVVNVIDNTIPTTVPDDLDGAIEGRFSDNTIGEQALTFGLDVPMGDQFAAHFSGFQNETDDYQITGEAESEILHDAEGHEEHEEEEEEHEENHGVLENSSVESDGFNLGFSHITDAGHWGVSYSQLNRNYGIPGHAHNDEGHEEEHHDDEEEHEDEHEEEVVRIDLEKQVFKLKGLHRFSEDGFLSQMKMHYANSDYQHVELEGDEVGTVFDNEADEWRVELTHEHVIGFTGVWGLQWNNRDFSAIGEEAYILPSDTQNIGLFLIEERELSQGHLEFGARFDRQQVKTNLFPTLKDNAFSISAGGTWELNDQWTMPINFARAQRLPTAEELFSNQSGAEELIPHLATGTIEIGNIDLTHETANNFDIGLRYRGDKWQFNVSWFYNKVNDFIFLQETHEDHHDDDEEEEHEEYPTFVYQQQNATFKGFEADLTLSIDDAFNNQWAFRLFADATTAKLSKGGYVPRIPANRVGLNVNWSRGPWSVMLDYTHVERQNDLADYELPTASYDDMSLGINWLHFGTRAETLVFLKANNLLDEEIREHASFTKDIAPLPARSISAGLRVSF